MTTAQLIPASALRPGLATIIFSRGQARLVLDQRMDDARSSNKTSDTQQNCPAPVLQPSEGLIDPLLGGLTRPWRKVGLEPGTSTQRMSKRDLHLLFAIQGRRGPLNPA